METQTKNEPVYRYRLGRIVGVVWFNEGADGSGWRSVQVHRLYKEDGDVKWRRSSSFSRDDLPLVCKVADRCHTWILELRRKDSEQAEDK